MIYRRYGKRVFDLICSLVGLVVLSPVMIIVAVLIKLTSRGSVFFVQDRVGLDAVLFQMLKFRTMTQLAEGEKSSSLASSESYRITGIGRILRKFKLDELPQLFNVLKGDMSLVGPRPEVQEYVDYYTDKERKVLSVRPGITSPASIKYKNEEDLLSKVENIREYYIDVLMRDKLKINLEYIDSMSLMNDLGVILRTLVW